MKTSIRNKVYEKYNGRCAYTGKLLDGTWQVDHVTSRFEYSFHNKSGVDNIDNLLPAMIIVNHYKRSKNLEQFRDYMFTFHTRLSKLPKKTGVERTKKRIEYMNEIASLFDISIDKPFNGTFYFENLRQ